MMTKLATAGALVALAFGLGACSIATIDEPMDAPLGQDFGNPTAHNAAVQIVDPNPANANAGAPEFDGERSTVVITDYKAAEVATTEAESTK